MRVLLDTSILIFSIQSPERLSNRAVSVLGDPANIREISSVSLTEIAIKTTLGKLRISVEDARQALRDMDVRILPFTADHAFNLFHLSAHRTDPFDRQIIAQALFEDIPVVTSDEKFRLYKGLRLIW